MPNTTGAADEYPVFVMPDARTDGSFCYVAYHPDLPGCVGYGDGIMEAKVSLANARGAYLKHLIARSEVPPVPSASPMLLELRSGLQAKEFSAWDPSKQAA